MKNKIVFTEHAKIRAYERLDLDEEYNSLMFETKLKDIFLKSRKMYPTDDGKDQYEAIYNSKKINFICINKDGKIIINTLIVK